MRTRRHDVPCAGDGVVPTIESVIATHLDRLRTLGHQLAHIAPPATHDIGDGIASEAAQAVALGVLHSVQGIVSAYVNTVPLGPHEDARMLPAGYGDVATLADALIRRSSWLHHAWLCNQYGMPNTWREPPMSELSDSLAEAGIT